MPNVIGFEYQQKAKRRADELTEFPVVHRLFQSVIYIGQILISPRFHVVNHIHEAIAQLR